jgi:hypothetical protein
MLRYSSSTHKEHHIAKARLGYEEPLTQEFLERRSRAEHPNLLAIGDLPIR